MAAPAGRRQRVEQHVQWRHTADIAGGLVVGCVHPFDLHAVLCLFTCHNNSLLPLLRGCSQDSLSHMHWQRHCRLAPHVRQPSTHWCLALAAMTLVQVSYRRSMQVKWLPGMRACQLQQQTAP